MNKPERKYYKFFFSEEIENPIVCDKYELQGFHRYGLWAGKHIIDWPAGIVLSHDGDGKFEDYLGNSLGWIVFSRQAKDLLAEAIGTQVQFLPISVTNRVTNGDKRTYYALNVLHKISGLHLSKSVYEQFETGNYSVIKPVLNLDAIDGFDIFRLAESPARVYVSERVKNVIDEYGLTGIQLTLVKTSSADL